MVIEKVLNNNVVVSKNELGKEIICMGKGIAFQKKPGDHISKNDVCLLYTSPSPRDGLLSRMPSSA